MLLSLKSLVASHFLGAQSTIFKMTYKALADLDLATLSIFSASLPSHSVLPSVRLHTWALQPQLPRTGSSISRMLLLLSLLFHPSDFTFNDSLFGYPLLTLLSQSGPN